MSFFELRWLGRDRLNGYSRLLFAALLLATIKPYRDAIGAVGSDFFAFWSAGRLAISGAAGSVYDTAATAAVQASAGRDDIMAFVNPPAMIPLVAPLGWMTFPVAWIVWVAATFALWFVLTRRLAPRLAWPVAAYPGAMLSAWHAQAGLLTGGLWAGAAGFMRTRPFVAGLFFGALVVKPHLAVLVPLALLAGRHWSAIAGAALSAIGLTLFAWLLFGPDVLLNYPESFPVSRHLVVTGDTDFYLRMTTVYAAARVTLGDPAALILQAAVSLAVAVLTWTAWSRPGPAEGKIALLVVASALVTPYLFSYDLPFLIVPFLWLAGAMAARGWRRWDRPMLAFLYVSPLLTRALAMPAGFNFMPLALLFMLCLVWKTLQEAALPGPVAEPAPFRANTLAPAR